MLPDVIVVDEGIVLLEVIVVVEGIVVVVGIVLLEVIVVVEGIVVLEVIFVVDDILVPEDLVVACAAAVRLRIRSAVSAIVLFICFLLGMNSPNTFHEACQKHPCPEMHAWQAFTAHHYFKSFL